MTLLMAVLQSFKVFKERLVQRPIPLPVTVNIQAEPHDRPAKKTKIMPAPNRQFYPMQVNEKTGEPYLRLPKPHDNIIMTPPRMTDVQFSLENMNDPAIYKWLESPPFPYLPHHADEWVAKIKAASDTVLEELEVADRHDPLGEKPLKIVGDVPVRVLREVQEDGSDIFIGDIGTFRSSFLGVPESMEREKMIDRNQQRPIGDPEIVWSIGDYLKSSHHGRGIMSAAVKTLVYDWMIPRMNARLIRVEAFVGNEGSLKVFLKNGFAFEQTVRFAEPKRTNSGQLHEGINIAWLRLP
ncbi:hypothetical protein K474DRAFT_1710478 [Panus rudis PR-1116 ss-1]|nr:hypothetical protein K474DRAFT_1710478 [Panus rudis PR-1116 ss-1]